jgi:hypothetical protein
MEMSVVTELATDGEYAEAGLRHVVHEAVAALDGFGLRGRSPLHIRRALSVWPHSGRLSVDDADRVVLLLTTKCVTCGWAVELIPGRPEPAWRHVDQPDDPHEPTPADLQTGWNSGTCGATPSLTARQ